jgi:hypothetical protein
MFNLKFSTDNAAFGENDEERTAEIARILQEVSDTMRDRYGFLSGIIRDENGNSIGEWSVTGNDD